MTRVYFIFEIKLLVSDLQKLFLLNLTHNYEIMNNSNTRLAIPKQNKIKTKPKLKQNQN